MTTAIRTWYEFALAQFSADSYLDGIDFTNRNAAFEERLQFGSNHYNFIDDLPQNQIGATRMTEVMIDDFFKTG